MIRPLSKVRSASRARFLVVGEIGNLELREQGAQMRLDRVDAEQDLGRHLLIRRRSRVRAAVLAGAGRALSAPGAGCRWSRSTRGRPAAVAVASSRLAAGLAVDQRRLRPTSS